MWMTATTQAISDPHARFHQECLDFAEWARVKDFAPHERLLTKIRRLVRTRYQDAKFVLFGSAGSQLAVHGSDIDVLVCVPEAQIKFRNLFLSVHNMLLTEEWVEYAEKIASMVPIIKIKDRETGLSADVCFNREDSFKGVV